MMTSLTTINVKHLQRGLEPARGPGVSKAEGGEGRLGEAEAGVHWSGGQEAGGAICEHGVVHLHHLCGAGGRGFFGLE